MGVIVSELTNFKNKVESSINSNNMNKVSDDISSGIEELSIISKNVQSKIDSCYKSANKATILSNFDRVNEIYKKISTTVEVDLKSIINDSNRIVTLVKDLEKINEEIKEQQRIVNYNSGEDEESKRKKISAQSIISSKEREFGEKHSEALKIFDSLKSRDNSISFVEEFSTTNYEQMKDSLEYGTFEPKEFVSSNGKKVKYWLYVPDYGKEVDKLPVMLYMHGGALHQSVSLDHAKKYGLTSHIANRKITPSGIVIMPAVEDYTNEGMKALKELTDHVVDEYHADQDRVSVSGHSYGGIASFKLVNMYPGYWSCCIPISGVETVTKAFNGMKVWSFNGTSENQAGSLTSFKAGQNAVNSINSIGGEAYLTPLHTGHSGTNQITYEGEYKSPDGIVENPLEWGFRQKRT